MKDKLLNYTFFKSVLKSTTLKYVILLFTFGTINYSVISFSYNAFTNNLLTNLSNNNARKRLTGVINVQAYMQEYDENAKDLSSLLVADEGGNLSVGSSESYNSTSSSLGGASSSKPSSTITSNGTSSNIRPNYSSLIGMSVVIEEGSTFDPIQTLQLKAIDIDGKNITDKITIKTNQVNTERAGQYPVSVEVRLNNGTTLTQTFYVTVKATPLKVTVSNVRFENSEVNKQENIKLWMDIQSSKSYISPVSIRVNGEDYSLVQGQKGQYYISILTPDTVQRKTYTVESVTMTDGTEVNVNHAATVDVLKAQPAVDLVYHVDSKKEELVVTVNVSDPDEVFFAKQVNLTLYDEQGNKVASKHSAVNRKYVLNFSIPNNGNYTLKVHGKALFTLQGNAEEITLHEEKLTVDSIDRTTLTGVNAKIPEGSNVDLKKDLQLSATDQFGKDVTDQLMIDSQVNPQVPGVYPVKVSFTNTDGQLVEKIYEITVTPVQTKIDVLNFTSILDEVGVGGNAYLQLGVDLSKDYVAVKEVMINQILYPVTVDSKSEDKTYIVEVPVSQTAGEETFELTKVVLSNEEELNVKAQATVQITETLVKSRSVVLFDVINDMQEKVERTTVGGATVGADTTHQTDENNKINASVGIVGTVRNKNNEAPAGKIEVSLPTRVSFVVNPDGSVQTPNVITVTNSSASADVLVSVVSFTDSTPEDGVNITVEDYDTLAGQIAEKDRSRVGLKLTGNYQIAGTTNSVSLVNGALNKTPLLQVTAGSSANLTMQGIAGTRELGTSGNYTGVDATGTSDEFTITFQIKKQ